MTITKNSYTIEIQVDSNTTNPDILEKQALPYLPGMLSLSGDSDRERAAQRVVIIGSRCRLTTFVYSLQCAVAGKQALSYLDSFDSTNFFQS